MLRAGARVCSGLRWSAAGLAGVLALTAISDQADARNWFRRHRAPAAEAYQPSYASIVVDANSGKVLQQTNADSPRHPASLTKIMTLYLLFERLESGKIKLTTEMPVSAFAASQAPSKLGLKPGETIKVETAIRAIVTKSANDVAVILAEALGGDEPNFARLMTAKARALGMKGTTYRNASGLPEDQQYTTAQDQALLGRAIRERFPNYYQYFSTRTFEFRGKSVRNHNHLLGAVAGVDGIKTGYIHDSGFNIVTSVRRDHRDIVAVVFGGRTANERDARVRSLIDGNINIAAVKRTAPPVGEAIETADASAKDSAKPAPKDVAKDSEAKDPPTRTTAPASVAETAPPVGSTDPIKPNAVKTFIVHPGIMHTASLSPLPSDNRKLTPTPAGGNQASVTTVAIVKSDNPALPPPPGAKPGVLGVLPAKPAQAPTQVASAGDSVPVPAAAAVAAAPAAKPRSGWMIQVGAFPDEKEAKQRLIAAQGKAKDLLGRADPFTEKIAKGDKSLYRARFARMEKDQAESACKHLKRSEIPCMLVKN
jgi:D-alanyl-D-alanine carboxypeptidase